MKKKIALWTFLFVCLLSSLVLIIEVDTIRISGNKTYSDEEIKTLLFGDSRNSAKLFFEGITGEKKTIPFVETYSVEWINPMEINLIVYEKSIVAYVSYVGSYLYFDKDGIVVESDNLKLERIPQIEGLDLEHIVLYQPLPVKDKARFERLLNITSLLKVYGIEADAIRVEKDGSISLLAGGIEVMLGDARYVNGQLSELKDILVELTGSQGTLYLDNYRERMDTPQYTFKERD